MWNLELIFSRPVLVLTPPGSPVIALTFSANSSGTWNEQQEERNAVNNVHEKQKQVEVGVVATTSHTNLRYSSSIAS